MKWVDSYHLSEIHTVEDFEDLIRVINNPALTEFQYMMGVHVALNQVLQKWNQDLQKRNQVFQNGIKFFKKVWRPEALCCIL